MAEADPGTDPDLENPGQEDQSSLEVVAVRKEGSRALGQSLLAAAARTLARIVEDSEAGSHTVEDNPEVGRGIRVGLVAGLGVAEVPADLAVTNSDSHLVSLSSTMA